MNNKKSDHDIGYELGYKHGFNEALMSIDMGKPTKLAKKLGALGGKATLKKYGKKQMTEWGKKGGRPRKDVKKEN